MLSLTAIVEAIDTKKFVSLTNARTAKLSEYVNKRLWNELNINEGIVTKDDYLNMIRDGYDYARRINEKGLGWGAIDVQATTIAP